MISHLHKCIFIHIPKTAGMSIETSFLKSLGLTYYLGESAPLLLTYNKNPKVGPPVLAHMSSLEYTKYNYITEKQYSDYFTFTFVRNPWERIISIYKHFHYHRVISLTTFLKQELPILQKKNYYFVKPQVDYIFNENGDKLVDFIGRFENINKDFEIVKENSKHPLNDLSHVNKSIDKFNFYSRWNLRHIKDIITEKPYLLRYFNPFYNSRKSYQELFTEEAREIVEKTYKKDIEILGYTF